MRVFWVILALLGGLNGCVASSISATVEPVNDDEFRAMIKVLRPQMKKQGVIDAEGAWYSPMFGSSVPTDAGQVLLTRLSPAFRFPGMKAELLPSNFKGMLAASAEIKVSESSFSVKQGLDKIFVGLLAVTDWNHDGKNDWLVLCRIEPQSTPGGKREYYLAVTDLEKPIFVPQVIAIRDCVFGRCQVLGTVEEPGLVQDSAAAEIQQGQEAVTQAPKEPVLTPARAKQTSGKISAPPRASGTQEIGSGLSRESLNQ